MHFSRLYPTSALRLAGALATSVYLLFAFAGNAFADFTPCASGTTTWVAAGGGNWDTTSNWSNGQPSASCNTVIAKAVTVTLSTTTQHFGSDNGTGVNGIALSGGATLVVEGEASGNQGNWLTFTQLGIGSGGLTIGQGSTLDLEATGNSATTPTADEAPGGGAYVIMATGSSVPFVNDGTINATTTDSTYGDYLQFGADLVNTGTINASSGTLNLDGTSPMLVNNNGSFNVASGAGVVMNAGDGSSFTNSGSYSNQGTTTLSSSMHFIQSGGSESGNPVQMTGGETLEDSAGAGSFEVIDGCGGGYVTGTIPQGQTITVQGATQNCSGNTGQQSALTLGSGPNPPAVVNHGTIVLNASGNGNTSGGSAQLDGAELDNYGTVNATVSDPDYTTTILSPLVNESGGTVNLTGGKLYQTAGTPTTNNGTVSVGPGSNWVVQGGSFTNAGTLAIGIAGASNTGEFTMTAGGVFKAGGTLAPTLSGYSPASGAEFPLFQIGTFSGTFGTVSGGFRADYSKETASPAYVGVIYGAAASAPAPAVRKLSGGPGKLTLKLSCAKGAKSSCGYSFTGTVGKTKVASGHGTVKPGKTVTLALKLNKAGTALLKKRHRLRVKVLVTAGGRTLKSATVTVTKAVRKK
jgi:fibronectin-binding autotransporter adhesin